MTGPEHYRHAERLVGAALQQAGGGDHERAGMLGTVAQVHATLALAAATATLDAHEGPGGGSSPGRSLADAYAWDAVLANEPAAADTPKETDPC